jgi:hypothetical protein
MHPEDLAHLAERRAAERARDAAEAATYEAECLRSWGMNPPHNVVLTARYPAVRATA